MPVPRSPVVVMDLQPIVLYLVVDCRSGRDAGRLFRDRARCRRPSRWWANVTESGGPGAWRSGLSLSIDDDFEGKITPKLSLRPLSVATWTFTNHLIPRPQRLPCGALTPCLL